METKGAIKLGDVSHGEDYLEINLLYFKID